MRKMNPLALALIASAAMPAVGADVEVIPRPSLGRWVENNNRIRRPKLKRVKSQLNRRVAPATGRGSYDEWRKHLAAERAARRLSESET